MKGMFDSFKTGKQITLLRKNKGITQEELARSLAVSPQAVSKWENGHSMPEITLLVELVDILGVTTDEILRPGSVVPSCADFEQILLPYDAIADFSGRKWPRSMARPAILAAIKLLMGLEDHKDAANRQMNDDTEYILQSAFNSVCFGYSWGEELYEKNCLGVYGLSGEVYDSERYDHGELIRLAADNIKKGYPVVVEPIEYEDIILATGFSGEGRVLKGLPFLDGDDEKNSCMSFERLLSFPGWYRKPVKLILIRPSAEKVSKAEACREALRKGHQLLTNEVHRFEEPLKGYGLVIYDNWRGELVKENENHLETVNCLYPHIFIHYESKLRIRQFLELCGGIVAGMDREALEGAVRKYNEIIALCENAMQTWLTETPENAAAAGDVRRGFDWMLRRSRGLEAEALSCWAMLLDQK